VPMKYRLFALFGVVLAAILAVADTGPTPH
jgi:hypothetical protein